MSPMDFKVRVINAQAGTGAPRACFHKLERRQVGVGNSGVSENVIEASWQALVDAVEYKLVKDIRPNRNPD